MILILINSVKKKLKIALKILFISTRYFLPYGMTLFLCSFIFLMVVAYALLILRRCTSNCQLASSVLMKRNGSHSSSVRTLSGLECSTPIMPQQFTTLNCHPINHPDRNFLTLHVFWQRVIGENSVRKYILNNILEKITWWNKTKMYFAKVVWI